jgi:hypothetical protein
MCRLRDGGDVMVHERAHTEHSRPHYTAILTVEELAVMRPST